MTCTTKCLYMEDDDTRSFGRKFFDEVLGSSAPYDEGTLPDHELARAAA